MVKKHLIHYDSFRFEMKAKATQLSSDLLFIFVLN
jgi:hypothetical protein